MERRKKITVCGMFHVFNEIVRDSLKTMDFFEIVNSDNFRQTDIIYWISGKGPSIIKYFLCWIKKDPLIINHWVGSDVVREMEKQQQQQGINRMRIFFQECIYRRKMKTGGLIHLAEAPWLADELSKININALYLPITTIDVNKLGTGNVQQVKDIDFLCYVPFKRFNFYGGDKIIKIAERWQNYSFFLMCSDLNEIPSDLVEKMPKNVTISPRVEREKILEFYQRSKFFIRYTLHDGISISVLEALYYRLQVLWTYDFPCTQKIETQEKLSDSIPYLIKNWQPNEKGNAYVIENFSIEKWRAQFLEIIQSKLHENMK